MLGYHVAYSKPIRNIYKSILDMDLYEVLALALSCLFWKRYHDYIKIYCDEDYYNKLKNMDLLWLWDEVDNKTMSSIPQNLNHDRFWSYSKMYINSLQSEQFYNIDLDLFTRAPMPEFTTDFTVAHYEIVDSKKSHYYDFHKMKEFENFFKGFKFHKAAVNTSLFGVSNFDAYKDFMKWVNGFVIDNWVPLPESAKRFAYVIHSEQRMFFSWCLNNGYTMKSIMNRPFDCNSEEFLDEPTMDDGGIFHLWALKDKYKNPKYAEDKIKMTTDLIEGFQTHFPEEWDRFKYSISNDPI